MKKKKNQKYPLQSGIQACLQGWKAFDNPQKTCILDNLL